MIKIKELTFANIRNGNGLKVALNNLCTTVANFFCLNRLEKEKTFFQTSLEKSLESKEMEEFCSSTTLHGYKFLDEKGKTHLRQSSRSNRELALAAPFCSAWDPTIGIGKD